ncbi:hypothetical protein CTTA_3447 [Comamonas testosteroni]|uniref:Transcription factor LuxR-like autoinducer-binding domain-containing protein n=1 Tax=Comamonas testosteroni TaxID=285 RepID=A0A5A7MFH4_COMTE|nr:hypothetical protein CTTA_3447 [Comamonas testosteroni]
MSTTIAQAAFHGALAIEGARSLATIQDTVRAVGVPLGYDRFVLFSASSARDDAVKRIYWIEGDWFGTGAPVDAETYVRHCPVTRHILETNQPFFWTKTNGAQGERYSVVRAPQGPGIHGLQVPVFGLLGLEGAMSLGGERIDASPQARLGSPTQHSARRAGCLNCPCKRSSAPYPIANVRCSHGRPPAGGRRRLPQPSACPNALWKTTCAASASAWALPRRRRPFA